MSDWIKRSVKDISRIVSGSTPSTERAEYWNGEIVWITPLDLSKQRSRFIHDSERRITLKGLKNSSARLIPANSLVMSSRAPIGYFAVSLKDFATNQGCKSFIFKNGNDVEYFYYFFTYFKNGFLRLGEGSTFTEITKSKIEGLSFTIPTSVREQCKIAKVLITIDDAIEATEKIIAKRRRIKEGLMQDLFRYGLDKSGRLRSEGTHKFKDSPLGRIPEEWQVADLRGVTRRGGGGIQIGPFGSQLHARDYVEDGIPIITVEHLVDSRISHENVPKVGNDDYARLKKYRLQEGDLVYSRVGAIDRCSYVSEKEDGWLFSGRCLRVRPGSKVDPRFLLYRLNTRQVSNSILSRAVGSTMRCLNTTILSELLVAIPQEYREQCKIGEVIAAAGETVEKEETYRDKLVAQKRGLMEDLLTGKVRVDHLMKHNERN